MMQAVNREINKHAICFMKSTNGKLIVLSLPYISRLFYFLLNISEFFPPFDIQCTIIMRVFNAVKLLTYAIEYLPTASLAPRSYVGPPLAVQHVYQPAAYLFELATQTGYSVLWVIMMHWFATMFFRCCFSPFGHWTSMFETLAALPRPNRSFSSFCDK